MIDYLYSLDYQIKDCLADSDQDSPEKASIFRDFEGATTVTKSVRKLEYLIRSPLISHSIPSYFSFDPLLFHILMYSLADRMFIEGLKALSKVKVERGLVQRLDANKFQSVIIEIDNSTPASDGGLRDLAVKITLDHLTQLRPGDETTHMAFPNSLVELVPQFSSDLFVSVMDKTVFGWNQHGLCREN
ncbi:unnamed protein product [Penicillium salamii]|uniref:Uncharacterized protein n=1 Tax=Penicillium salamii TaxID=1612424 RepID=A0A9W4N391_9EURO|nr:unnamed protein product [Penicillium salamii]CAG8172676.1 unnamed protein product [Penicillium salamii]CAG8268522.1 unnamed protein product [Penicillium salamii]CAG8270585.1 unnamed protein product [Penicillium salamii]CAG8393503.1 unnamed protein product [Penicillium salamii]